MEHSIRITAALLASCLAVAPAAHALDVIAWTGIGEAVSAGPGAVPVQHGAKVVRVDVQPAIVEVAVGVQVCISTLKVHAIGADRRLLAGVHLAISVREDQKLQLQLARPKGDICMRPARPGEYPIRFTSYLTAPDDTLRGAQVFLRAR